MTNYSRHDSTDKLLNQKLIVWFAYSVYAAGLLIALYFFITSIQDQDWISVFLTFVSIVCLTLPLYQLWSGDVVKSFGTYSLTVFILNLIGITLTDGLRSPALVIQFPVLFMLGIAWRKKTTSINLIGGAFLLVVLLIYYLDSTGFYIMRDTEPLTSGQRLILVGFTILFTIMILHVIAYNLKASQKWIEKSREEAIQEKIKAEVANNAKLTFLATMSHELRTPLNAIIGYSEMISEDSDGVVQSDADKIRLAASNLLNIINSILEVSKIEKGVARVHLESIDVITLLNQVSIMIGPQSNQRNNNLVLLNPAETIFAMGDVQKLLQVLINLINNANKFTQNGTITLETKYLESKVCISVKDTGIGISPSDLERIFEPFGQVNSAYNRQFDGVGLGLSICKDFIRMMDGQLTVASEVGVGSTFTILLSKGN